MREEIESAQNQSSVHSKRFDKTPNNLLLSSQQSDLDVSRSLDGINGISNIILQSSDNFHFSRY